MSSPIEVSEKDQKIVQDLLDPLLEEGVGPTRMLKGMHRALQNAGPLSPEQKLLALATAEAFASPEIALQDMPRTGSLTEVQQMLALATAQAFGFPNHYPIL